MGYQSGGTKRHKLAQTGTNGCKPAQNGTIICAAGLFLSLCKGGSYKSKTTSGTVFFYILPILELMLTALISTGQYRSNKSKVAG